jgi:hypothetical protein
MIYKKK